MCCGHSDTGTGCSSSVPTEYVVDTVTLEQDVLVQFLQNMLWTQ